MDLIIYETRIRIVSLTKMVLPIIVLFCFCTFPFFAQTSQSSDTLNNSNSIKPSQSSGSFGDRNKSAHSALNSPSSEKAPTGIAFNFSEANADLGIGISIFSQKITSKNIVFGFSGDYYFKHFTNNSLGANVTNLSMVFPLYIGYKIIFPKAKNLSIIPTAGLFGAVAFQNATFANGNPTSATIADWGYLFAIKCGYDFGRVFPYLGFTYYNNFDANHLNGYFFRAVPINIGMIIKHK